MRSPTAPITPFHRYPFPNFHSQELTGQQYKVSHIQDLDPTHHQLQVGTYHRSRIFTLIDLQYKVSHIQDLDPIHHQLQVGTYHRSRIFTLIDLQYKVSHIHDLDPIHHQL